MKELIRYLSVFSVMLLFLHEFDAFYHREWKMFAFLKKLSEKQQYMLFLYVHIPLTLFLFYYLWSVMFFSNNILWITVNGVFILHFLIHVVALKWKSNVFTSIHSFIFIAGMALLGAVNMCLMPFY